MKTKQILTILAASVALAFTSTGWAAARIASVTGDWNSTATWGGSPVPGATDSVTINSGITVTVPSGYAAQCTTITFAGSTTATSSIVLADNTASLTASSTVTIPRPNTTGLNKIDVGAGTFSAASVVLQGSTTTRLSQLLISTGTATVSGNITSAGVDSQIIFSGAGVLNVGGNFMTGTLGTFTPSTGTVNFNGSGAQSITLAYTFNNFTVNKSAGVLTLSANATIDGDLTVTAGTLDLASFTANRSSAGGTMTVANGATLRIGGTGTLPSDYTAHSIGATSTIEYYGTGQAVAALNSSQTYGNLTLSGSGTKTAAANLDITGNFTVSATAVFAPGAAVVLNSGGAAGTITGTGTIQVTRTASTADLFNQYKFLTYTLTGLTVDYAGAGDQTVNSATYGALTTSGGSGTKALDGAVTINGAVTIGTGTTLAAGANAIDITGNWVNNGNFSATGSQTVTFTAGSATIGGGSATTTYRNLTISGSGTRTAAANFAVASVFTIGTGATFSGSTYTITLSGGSTPFVVDGTFTIGTSTIKYTSATGANVTATTYHNLTLDSPGQTFTAAGNVVVGIVASTGVLTVAADTTFAASDKTITLQSTGTPLVVTGTFSPGTSTVSYTSTATSAANVAGVNYYNLSVNGNGAGDTFTAAGDMTIGNVLTIGSTATFSGSSRTITLSGSGTPFAVNGTFTVSTSTIKYTSTTGANVTGTSYYNLTLDSSGQTFMAAGDLTVSKVLAIAASTTFNGSSWTISLTDITSGATPFVVNGTFTPSTSTVLYNNTSTTADNVAGVTYYNLTVNGNSAGDTFTAGGNITVANVFTVSVLASDATFNASTHTITLSGAGTPLVVNGTFTPATSTVRYTSATGANVTGTSYNNLTLDSSGQTFTAAGNLSAASVLTVAANTTFDGSNRTITLSGSGTPLIVNATGTFTPSTSTVTYSSASGATVSALNYNNLSFTGTGLFTLGGNIGVAGTCTVASGNLLSCGNNVISGAGTFTLASGGNLQIGSANGIAASAASGNVQTTTRNFNTGANYTYNGAAAQVTGDGLPATVNNFTNDNSAGLTLSGTVSVSGTLALTSGKIITGANQINVANTANTSVVGASSSTYVFGTLQKSFAAGNGQSFTFPIGDAANYTPVGFASMNVTTTPGTVAAKTTAGDITGIASSGLNSAKSVNRYWTLTAGGGINITANTATFNFINPGDLDAGVNTSAFVIRRFSGSWSTTTTGTRTSTSTAASAITSLGDFAIGEQLIDHYSVTASSPQSPGATFSTTVTAQDVLNQTVVADNSTVVTMGDSTGNVQYDSDGNGLFGDNSKTLTAGTFTINTRDFTSETVNLTATDGSASGTLTGLVIGDQAGDFRSLTSGDWASTGTWERYSGSAWVTGFYPTNQNANVVTIQNGHVVTVAATLTMDQIVVKAGGQLNANANFTLNNVAGAELDVFGTFQNSAGTFTSTGADIAVQSGGNYKHNRTGGTIITATWDANSTCEITGATTTQPGGLGQSFGHFIWNPSAQAANNLNLAGGLTAINGDFTVVNTGTSGSLRLTAATVLTLSIGGDLVVQGGRLALAASSSGFTPNVTVNVAGDVSVTGGTLDIRGTSANTSGSATLNVAGDFSVSASGTIAPTVNASGNNINFTKSGTQTYANAGTVSGQINWTVNSSSTVDLGTSVISGTSGTFTLSSGGGLKTAHASGLDGNITVTGTKTFATDGNYTYNGAVAQVPGSLLPATVNNLTIANAAGVTINSTHTVSGLCTVNSSALLLGTGTINGSLIVNGTLAPGTSIGTFTVGNSPTLNGTLLMEIDKAGSPNTDKLVVSGNPLAYAGTLTVNNIGAALTGGEDFDLFDANGFSGSFSATNLPALGSGLNWWTGRLMTDGRLRVNQAPLASNVARTRSFGLPLKIKISDLQTEGSWSDPDGADGDAVSFQGVNSGGQGATVTTNDTYVFYTPANNNNDTLVYTVRDTRGGSKTANIAITVSGQPTSEAKSITVTGGEVTVVFQAIHGFHYDVERAEFSGGPWSTLAGYANVTPDGNARITVTDTPPGGWTSAFYRLKWLGN